MFTIRKATTADIPVINKLAWEIFPRNLPRTFSPKEQTEYMMEWMYSPENLHKQMEEEGHIYYIAYEECEPAGYVSIQQEGEHLFHLQKIYCLAVFPKVWVRKNPVPSSHVCHQGIASRSLSHGAECKPQQSGFGIL